MSNAIPTDHIPNIRHLEIHITYRCNLRCVHCSNLITQAPSNETMPVAQVQDLLDQSAELNWPWEWLVLHGGEPTLHPQFEDICIALHEYQLKSNPTVRLFVCTNGFSKLVAERMEIAAKHNVAPENSRKDGKPLVSSHVPFSVSALDTGEDYMLGCYQSSMCGIAYNNHGFYECSPAAAGNRLFGYEPLATRLKDVTAELLATGFHKHCANCGFARVQHPEKLDEYRTGGPKHSMLDAAPDEPMSPIWVDAVRKYKDRKVVAR